MKVILPLDNSCGVASIACHPPYPAKMNYSIKHHQHLTWKWGRTFRQIRTTHPGLHPDVEIPNAVTSVRIERIAHFIVKRVEVAIDGERSVGVVG